MGLSLSARARGIAPSPTLSIDAKTKAMVSRGEQVINLSVGEPDFETPPEASLAAVGAIAAGFTKYTAVAGIMELRRRISQKLEQENGLRYEPDEILVSVGAKHSLFNIMLTLVDPGDEVIIPAPYWVTYPEQVRLAGGVPVILPTDESTGFKVTPGQLKEALGPKTKAVILNSPSNPTGAVYRREELEALAEVLRPADCYVISDEIYEKLIYGVEHVSIASLDEEIFRKTLVVNGFSKAFSMTGWRLGYTAGPKDVIKAMTSLQSQSTSNPTSIAQKAGVVALDHFDPDVVEEFRARRDYVLERLRGMPYISCAEPEGAFYLFPNVSKLLGGRYRGQTIDTSDRLCELLLEEARVSLVPGSGFGAPNNIRLSYAVSRVDLEIAMERMEAFLGDVER
ncbi:MAG: pyridoxal phosphate-dependent aminotransferase [Kyrpidia tusciae]|nr:pyridoxal phosphate-dependent aminotransferase [Kyrpidia tusciae]MBE3552364.1 pyridoxal phosphate-dependent aminotransferase [Kyrpidia tusciae]